MPTVNSTPEPSVVFNPTELVGNATPVEQVLQRSAEQEVVVGRSGEMEVSVHAAEVKIQIGLKSESGFFTDHSRKLPRENADHSQPNPAYNTVERLLEKYSNGRQSFAINLSNLTDGDGTALVPIPQYRQTATGPVLETPEEAAASFEKDMKDLRSIAKEIVGIDTWSWSSYPQGYRAITGNTPALNTGDSHRLRDHFDYNINHLKTWIKEIDAEEYTPDPSVTSPVQQDVKRTEWETEQKARKAQATKGFFAAMELMRANKAALNGQIRQLEEMASNGTAPSGVGARLEKLRRARDSFPDGQIPKDAEKATEARQSGQTTRMAAVLYAASRLFHGKGKPDLEKRHAAGGALLNSFPKPSKDCSGYFTFMKTKGQAELLPDNVETEKDFLHSLELLSLNIPEDDRRQFEHYRKALGAKERSDGPELFFVQLAGAVATDANKIGDSFAGSAFTIAFGALDPQDQDFCRQAIGTVAGRMSQKFLDLGEPSSAVLQDPDALVRHYNVAL